MDLSNSDIFAKNFFRESFLIMHFVEAIKNKGIFLPIFRSKMRENLEYQKRKVQKA